MNNNKKKPRRKISPWSGQFTRRWVTPDDKC